MGSENLTTSAPCDAHIAFCSITARKSSEFLEELRTLDVTSFQESHILAEGNLCLACEAPAGTVQSDLVLEYEGYLHSSKSPDLPSVLSPPLVSHPGNSLFSGCRLCLRMGRYT